jgi:putative sterol carrier protein/1,2-phenylacetyl-CoA epoxidase catalytic subunit
MAETATARDKAQRMAIDSVSYKDLYKRWEAGNWKSTEIDFSQDRHDWHETFTDLERSAAIWNYSMFFHGEDSVTDNLSPYIDAAPLEEQKYFLATQQVDEARHAVFFGRFMSEVVERGDTIASSLTATQPELTWGFRKTFEYLDKVADGLRRDRSKPNFAAAITMYHLVVEATLAQPGQHFIEGYLADRKILPGFYAGMQNISRDEQRHIGFGVKCLSDLVREDPECRYAVADLLREVMPMSVAVFVPPNWDRRYVEVFGSTIEEVYLQGIQSFESKLRAAGLPLDELPGAPPLPADMKSEERVDRALAMLQAGFIGEKTGTPSRDPQKVSMLFDTIRRSVDTDATINGGATIQWDFKDAEPWFLRIDNGATRAEQGRVESPDITLRCAFDDWVDITAGREDARMAMLKGKLRPKGSIRMLLRMPKLFGR